MVLYKIKGAAGFKLSNEEFVVFMSQASKV